MATPEFRVLLDAAGMGVSSSDQDGLFRLYAIPRPRWFRANMVATVDGAATGDDGRSGSINSQPDHLVFEVLRRLADAIVVGAGTARVEDYGVTSRPLVVVSRSGVLPERLRDADPGRVLLASCAGAPGLRSARSILGRAQVLVLGDEDLDLALLPGALADRGLHAVLCEGGPRLLGDLMTRGLIDELCLTTTPLLVGGSAPRVVHAAEGRPMHARAGRRPPVRASMTVPCRRSR